MHYHIEHHVFPMVPYYNLPELHEAIKSQLPTPYSSIWECYSKMIPTLIKQCDDPDYYEPRTVPPPINVRRFPRVYLSLACHRAASPPANQLASLDDACHGQRDV